MRVLCDNHHHDAHNAPTVVGRHAAKHVGSFHTVIELNLGHSLAKIGVTALGSVVLDNLGKLRRFVNRLGRNVFQLHAASLNCTHRLTRMRKDHVCAFRKRAWGFGAGSEDRRGIRSFE